MINNRLKQVDTFKEQGYLILRDVLNKDFIGELRLVIDKVESKIRESTGEDGRLNIFRVFERDDIFMQLIDNPSVYPLIFNLLGQNVQIFTSHISVYPPEPADEVVKITGSDIMHRDGSNINDDLNREGIFPEPMLSVRVIYWLTDVSSPEHGALQLIPKSHLIESPDMTQKDHFIVKAGDVTVHDRRLFHARGYNTSESTRIMVAFGYSYRWLRFVGDWETSETVIEKCNPLQQQLIGATFGSCPHGCF